MICTHFQGTISNRNSAILAAHTQTSESTDQASAMRAPHLCLTLICVSVRETWAPRPLVRRSLRLWDIIVLTHCLMHSDVKWLVLLALREEVMTDRAQSV